MTSYISDFEEMVIDSLSMKELKNLRDLLFREGPIYVGSNPDSARETNTLFEAGFDEDTVEEISRAVRSNQLIVCINPSSGVCIYAKNDASMVEFVRERTNLVFDGVVNVDLPVWRTRDIGTHHDGTPYTGYVPSGEDDEGQGVDRWLIVGLSPKGYAALLELEAPGDILTTMENSSGTKFSNCEEVADKLAELAEENARECTEYGW